MNVNEIDDFVETIQIERFNCWKSLKEIVDFVNGFWECTSLNEIVFYQAVT
jgi:uncharacterized protein (DUF779 family)